MKRKGYIFEKIIDLDNIKMAIKEASKGKRDYPSVKKICENSEYYAMKIQEMLINDTFKSSVLKHKKICEYNKIRDIAVPRFYPDQIIHWAVCIQLKNIFMKGMYKYNCGSIPYRGGIYGKKYIEHVNYKIRNIKTYTLKLDIRKYFNNVSHDKLDYLIARKIKDKKVLNLMHKIIDCGEEGIPIGFYTSQWLSNFYLEKLDHYIKEVLKIKYYVRYVDDMVLIDTNKRKLHKAKLIIQEFLSENKYAVNIKNNWQLWKTFTRPLDFLGYKFYKYYTLLRKRILKRFKRQLLRVERENTLRIVRARALCSFLGWLKHISNAKSFYLKWVKPIVSKKWIKRIISYFEIKKVKEIKCYGV